MLGKPFAYASIFRDIIDSAADDYFHRASREPISAAARVIRIPDARVVGFYNFELPKINPPVIINFQESVVARI